jgi:hypothetical protein
MRTINNWIGLDLDIRNHYNDRNLPPYDGNLSRRTKNTLVFLRFSRAIGGSCRWYKQCGSLVPGEAAEKRHRSK